MGITFEISTLILLFAPLFLPKLFSIAGRVLSRGLGSQKGTHPGPTASASRATATTSKRFIPSLDSNNALSVALAVYSLLSLILFKPFNLFTSLGGLPVNAPAGQIQVALSRQGLLEKYADDLNLLTSLDRRILYLHYGHANFVGCQQLLGSTAPRDLLAYSSIRLLQSAIGKGLLLALSNRRWRISLFLASIAGTLYHMYALATIGPQLSSADGAYLALSQQGPYWSHLGFLLLSMAALLLPSKRPVRALSPDEAILLQATQALVQRQDMIQTRIRVIDTARSLSQSERVAEKGLERRASNFSPRERQSLKDWLQAVVSSQTHAGQEIRTSAATMHDLPAVSTTLSPTHAVPVEREGLKIGSNQLPLPKSSSMQTVDDASFATAQVVVTGTSDDEEDDLRSPSLSRSSSVSSPIDTPTPAMRRPLSLDLTAAAARIAQKLGEEDSTDYDKPWAKQTVLSDHPVRLSQSLGPSGPVKHPNLLPKASIELDIFPEAATLISRASGNKLKVTEQPSSLDEAPTSEEEGAIIISAKESPLQAVSEQNASSTFPPGQQRIMETASKDPSSSEPVNSTPFHVVAEDGWTTVLSKKGKFKT